MNPNLRIDTSLDSGRELQRLLAQQQELQARIASLTQKQQHQSPTYRQQQRRSNVPRSIPTGTPSMVRHLSTDRIEKHGQRQRTYSQQSAPAPSMARTTSRGTSSQRSSNLPFTQNGPTPPPLNTEPRRDTALMAWVTQDPPYTYSAPPTQSQRSTTQRRSELQQVPEQGLGLADLHDIGDFISRECGSYSDSITPTFQISPSLPIPSSTTLNHRMSNSSFNMPTPSTPTTDSLTTATTLTSNMSRQNSLCNEPLLESIQMMKFNSNASFSTDAYEDHSMYDQVHHFVSSHHSRRSSNEEQSKLLAGAGGASHVSSFSPSFQSLSSVYCGEKMEKSESNESTSSSSSTSSRNAKRLQEQNTLAAARPIMPKGGSEAMSRENSSQLMTRLESKDGQDKVAISAKTYQRPKHERVFCKQCDSHQDGFRGEHELRRHQLREHVSMVKKFMCIEPADGEDHPKPVLPLSKCKACTQQKKKYGAYYNAAAHLRRAHFKPKSKGRSKNSKSDDAEKRGGKGGGDWPPMSELKFWMREVEEPAAEFPLTSAEQDAADLSDEEIDVDNQIFSQQMPNITTGYTFNNAYMTDATSVMNAYPAAVNININDADNFNMPNMPFDLSGAVQPTQNMDQSMYTASSQDFSPISLYQNESFAFYNNSSAFPQNLDDQVSGWS